jgi:Sec-independent protein translocase protein TatA
VTSHDLNLLIFAIIVIVTIAARLRGATRRFGSWAAKQQAAAQQAAAAARASAAAQIAAAQQAAAQQAAALLESAGSPVYRAPSPPSPSGARRTVPAPSMRSTAVPAFVPAPAAIRPRSVLTQAFADPAHARSAVILAEVLGKPLSLR